MTQLYSVDNGRWIGCGSKAFADIALGRKAFTRFDDVWNGLLFRLAREPEAGIADSHHPGVWVMETTATGNPTLPRISVLYRYDAAKAYILRLMAKP